MADYYSLYNLALESMGKKYSVTTSNIITIIGLLWILLPMLAGYIMDKWEISFSAKKEKFLNILLITFIILGFVPFVYGLENGIKAEKFEELIKKKQELKINIQDEDLIETGKKLNKFCENYYSNTNKSFCENQELNQYTYNVYFGNKYENNPVINEDIQKAKEYVENRKGDK